MKISGYLIMSLVMLSVGCGAPKQKDAKDAPEAAQQEAAHPAEAEKVPNDGELQPPPPPPEGRPVMVYRDGQLEKKRESEIDGKELHVINLSNYWVPFLFSERNNDTEVPKTNNYRPIFIKLANDWPYLSPSIKEAKRLYDARHQRVINGKIAALREEGVSEEDIRERLGLPAETVEAAGDSDENEAPPTDEVRPHSGAGEATSYLEVYGIPPTLSVLKERAKYELDKPCYDEIDYGKISAFTGFVAYESNERAKYHQKRGRSFASKMNKEMERLGIEDAEKLLEHPDNKMSKKLVEVGINYEALVEIQKQLECEELFEENHISRYTRGGLDWYTHEALVKFERKNRIFGWGYVGADTIEAQRKSRIDRLYDTFVRVMNERVADAMGLIEDGSVSGVDGQPFTYTDKAGEEHHVRNLVAEFTAATLKQMGISSPQKLVEFLESYSHKELDTLLVAVSLPSLPPYYGPDMQLHAAIDRGDVWYQYPYIFTESVDEEDHKSYVFKRRGQPRKRKPKTTLYVTWNDQDIPLVTMNTTIGSWRTELASDGYVYYRYKNSDVGERVWRDIVAGPVWMPPDSTPTGDLTKKVSYKKRVFEVPNYSEFGPHYASAYGLVAGFHHRQVEKSDGSYRYLDNGIRSHGSVDYMSILRRYSHGCHRLYNHLAIRMFNFVIHHKPFERVGEVPAGYAKTITNEDGDSFSIRLATRGYKYELKDPVPVTVYPGRVRGSQKTPVEGFIPSPDVEYGPDAQFLPEEFQVLISGDAPAESDTASTSDSASDGATSAADPATASAAPVAGNDKAPAEEKAE